MQYLKLSVHEYLIREKQKRKRMSGISEKTSREVYWQANNIRIAVAVMFPGDLLQQPTTPVQNAENIARKPTMNRAITDLPMSATIIKNSNVLCYLHTFCNEKTCVFCYYISEKFIMNIFMKIYISFYTPSSSQTFNKINLYLWTCLISNRIYNINRIIWSYCINDIGQINKRRKRDVNLTFDFREMIEHTYVNFF